MASKKELFLGSVRDAVAEILFYGRKNDEELSGDDVSQLMVSGEVTPDEIVAAFAAEIKEHLGE